MRYWHPHKVGESKLDIFKKNVESLKIVAKYESGLHFANKYFTLDFTLKLEKLTCLVLI